MSEIEKATAAVDAAQSASSAAQTATRDARSRFDRLQAELTATLEAERIAAENGKDATEHTARVRDVQDALRLLAYRIRKLETDEEMARVAWIDASNLKYRVELRAASGALAPESEKVEAATNMLRESFNDYITACGQISNCSARISDGGSVPNPVDYGSENVRRLLTYHLISRIGDLLQFCGGKDYNGRPIYSAADLRTEFGHDTSFLIKG